MSQLRHAIQALLRNPAFSLTALLTIVLGVGANTAVYTVVHSVLLEPLPFDHPKTLVQVWETHPELHNLQVSVPDYLDWKASVKSLNLAAYTFQAMNKETLLGQGDPMQVQATQASSDLFTVLGVQPILGRAFDARQEESKEPVVLISEKLWRDKFSADPAIIGRLLRLDKTSFTIIGVFGQKQAFPVWADVWAPLSFIEPERQSARKVSSAGGRGETEAGCIVDPGRIGDRNDLPRAERHLFGNQRKNWRVCRSFNGRGHRQGSAGTLDGVDGGRTGAFDRLRELGSLGDGTILQSAAGRNSAAGTEGQAELPPYVNFSWKH